MNSDTIMVATNTAYVDLDRAPDLPREITRASLEAHMAALGSLSEHTTRVVPDPVAVATALALAYGEAVGLLVASGATEEQVYSIGLTSLAARDAVIAQAQ